MLIQQGDVLLKRIDNIPANAKLINASSKGYVLAEGEATGHAHVIDKAADMEFYEKEGSFFIKNSKSVQVLHEEHATVEIPVGFWEVRKVKEYDHFNEEVRNVCD